MTNERDHGGGVATAIQLLQAVGDDQRIADKVLSYIDGINAGRQMVDGDKRGGEETRR